MAQGPRRHLTTAALLVAVIAFMGGLTAAAVPLYRIFCAATGYAGTTRRASVAPTDISKALITVRFDTDISADLPWEFRPLVREVQVHPGEQTQVFFHAVNRSNEGITGRAVYNVTPTKVGLYFDKLQCFCFNAQYLAPGESKDMGVVFFVDPDLLKDPSTNDVHTITLSYSIFKAADQQSDRPKTAKLGPNS
ncbi:MAG TPA: cytochrome c oxidase assembly protein [Stellaceae bacterium]|jgi:cytochrome c oxidase assembly protein subunit 11|nr:cytochrome c oxidase assembly protein [Stellaceae bacterium]